MLKSPLCFKTCAANCGTGDPDESGYHCCMRTLGHDGECECDECGRQFTPDGTLRSIGESRRERTSAGADAQGTRARFEYDGAALHRSPLDSRPMVTTYSFDVPSISAPGEEPDGATRKRKGHDAKG